MLWFLYTYICFVNLQTKEMNVLDVLTNAPFLDG